MLVKALKNMLERRATKIDTTQDLRTKCLNQKICAVLLKGTSKSVDGSTRKAMEKLLKEQPTVAFAHIDTTNLYVKNLEDQIPLQVEGQHRFVVFEKVSGSLATGDSRLITSMTSIGPGRVSYVQMSNLLASVVSKSASMKKLSALPQIKTRTKKLVQEELARRQRKENPTSSPTSSSSSSPPTANDGSREGRRAERERRRAAHREKHGYREKTPEEIQEMERQRRARMEAEAAKWNMVPDDAPEEGEPVSEEDESSSYYDIGGDDDEEQGDVDGSELHDLDDEGDDEDEDILDLD